MTRTRLVDLLPLADGRPGQTDPGTSPAEPEPPLVRRYDTPRAIHWTGCESCATMAQHVDAIGVDEVEFGRAIKAGKWVCANCKARWQQMA